LEEYQRELEEDIIRCLLIGLDTDGARQIWPISCRSSLSAHPASRDGPVPRAGGELGSATEPEFHHVLGAALIGSPYQKPRRRTGSKGSRKGGGKPGHAGHRQVLLAPTSVEDVLPESCACGSGEFDRLRPYYTHQVIELPPIEMEVTHWVLHQDRCLGCGGWPKAQVPGEQVTGYGPRLSALMAELAGTYGNGRRMVQTFCSSVLGVPISLGAIQKGVDRVSQTIDPYYTVIAAHARQAPVNSGDAQESRHFER